MPFLMRKVDKRDWVPQPWLPAGETAGDLLGSFQPIDGGRLSVWQVADDRSNLAEIIAALAATRSSVQPMDYTLFTEASIADLGIGSVETPGIHPLRSGKLLASFARETVRVSGECAGPDSRRPCGDQNAGA